MKTQIDLVDVRKLLELQKFINADSLDNIEWFDNGVKIEIEDETIDEWKYVGLTNLCFAEIILLADKELV